MSESYEEIQNEQPVVEEIKYPFTVPVRFRNATRPYSFGAYNDRLKKGDWVVVETAQGIEMGECEGDALNVEKYGFPSPQKPVVRKANEQDFISYKENERYEDEAFKICQVEIEDLGLDMNLLSAKYTLDRAKVLFVYLADQRVDFRELLKRLGAQLRCRIELRQIGERDKAKMVGGIGACGMECCCSRFKNHFDVISINMAKNQLLALNIEKLSGMCGKLMCCLKYEDEMYQELTEGLPKMNTQVEYEGQIYRITSMNVMSNQAKLENRETAMFITMDDLREKAIVRKGVVQPRKPEESDKPVVKKIVRLDDQKKEEKPAQKEVREKPERKSMNQGQKDQQNRRKNPNRNRRHNNRPNNQPEEKKNVTVRTFGKKKEGNA